MSLQRRRTGRQDAPLPVFHMTAEQRDIARELRSAERWTKDAEKLCASGREAEELKRSIQLAQGCLQRALEAMS